jgi:hypothetical protein
MGGRTYLLLLFSDPSREQFPEERPDGLPADTDGILHGVSLEGSRLLGEVSEKEKRGWDVGGQPAKPEARALRIAVYPRPGLLAASPAAWGSRWPPMPFSPGALKSLPAVCARFGEPIERELWSTEATRALGLDGTVSWWGGVGLATAEDGSIAHVLVRIAPE